MIVIKNAMISSREVVDILISGGRIERIAGEIEAPGAEIMDVRGRMVTHGIVGYLFTYGGESPGEIRITPNIRSIEETDILGGEMEDYLRQGITTLIVSPKNNNLIGGSLCAVKTYGALLEEGIIREDAAIKINLGGDEKLGEKMVALREFLHLIREYRSGKKIAQDMRIKLMDSKAVVRKRVPVIFSAESETAVMDAIRLIKKYELSGAVETPVRNRHLLKAMEDEGIVCIERAPADPREKGLREGMQEVEWQLVRVLNLDHRIGEIKAGADADLVVWEEAGGELLVKAILVGGNVVKID